MAAFIFRYLVHLAFVYMINKQTQTKTRAPFFQAKQAIKKRIN